MFLHETVEHCDQCDATTPHSRRGFAPVRWLAIGLFLAGVYCVYLGAVWIALGAVLCFAGLFAFRLDYETYKHVPCERCRGKLWMKNRDTKPTLDGNTEIQLFVGL